MGKGESCNGNGGFDKWEGTMGEGKGGMGNGEVVSTRQTSIHYSFRNQPKVPSVCGSPMGLLNRDMHGGRTGRTFYFTNLSLNYRLFLLQQ